MDPALPIDARRADIEAAAAAGPLVLSSPTGSGKSTRVPAWLAATGPVLVVEPRRVAARSLATRVAELEGVAPGGDVGWIVRDEHEAADDARVVFVTTGVALRMLRDGAAARFRWIVLDELHERTWALDLLLALVAAGDPSRLVIMSATIDGDRIAAHLGGTHVSVEGRLHPVAVTHRAWGVPAPTADGLPERVRRALMETADAPGDVLVFLPGKAEIRATEAALAGWGNVEVLPLHGGLTLTDQRRVFRPGDRRRVVLATNVAETSLTIPGVGVVVDSGLVRRTRYRGGRGHLALLPIAADSADQRAGRAGRLGPGRAVRLWPESVRLDARTPPEIHRESIVPLLLAAAACGHPDLSLPWLDPPTRHAVAVAREQLQALGALDEAGAVTPRGHRLFALPVDPRLGRLLVEGEARGLGDVVLPLVAGLSCSRRLFLGRPDDPEDDLREAGCDAVALVRAALEGRAGRHRLDAAALQEVHATVGRLARVLDMPAPRGPRPIDRRALAAAVLAAWPDAAHVARRRRRAVAWSNGGTELELGRESAVDPEKTDGVLVLDSIALTVDHRRNPLVVTAAMPIPDHWLVTLGVGRRRYATPAVVGGRVRATVEIVHAGRVLATEEGWPAGAALRTALRDLILAGRWGGPLGATLRRRLAQRALAAGLAGAPPPPSPEDWVQARLALLGVEEPEDIALLEPEDLLPAPLPPWEAEALDRAYPPALSLGDAEYAITYDPDRRIATLHQEGPRKDPPPARFLPRLPGWRIDWVHKNRRRTVRDHDGR